jgi:4-amino-4-deoxy-L-arabinose transferase-like glycosyltransferase
LTWLRKNIFLLVVIAACLITRLVALDADPPIWLSWSSGLFTDEGFYTLDARHVTLFGTWAPGNFHDRLISPALSLKQQFWFHIFGTSLMAARSLSVLFGLLTLVLFWLALWRGYGRKTADIGLLFLGLAPPVVFYNRMALQETPAAYWLVIAFFCWVFAEAAEHGKRRYVLFALAGAAIGVAIIFKSLAVFAVPALVLAACWPKGQEADRGRKESLIGLLTVLSIFGLIWYGPHFAEIGRMNAYYVGHQVRPHSAIALWWNIRRAFIGGDKGLLPYLVVMLPVQVICAALFFRKRKATKTELLLIAWFVGGILFCFCSNYAPSRYYVLFLPALCGLAAIGCAQLPRWQTQVAVIGSILVCGFVCGKAWTERDWSILRAFSAIAQVLPANSVLIGDFAPELAINSTLHATTVQPGLANDEHPIERLHADYVAVTRAPVWRKWWMSNYPGLVSNRNYVMTVGLGHNYQYRVDIYKAR